MKIALGLLSITIISNAMETVSQPITPRSFHTIFFKIKSHFEKIIDACKVQTDQSIVSIEHEVVQLHGNPDQELVSLLWNKHYRFSTVDICVQHEDRICNDMALLNNNRLEKLLESDQECLERARAKVMKNKILHQTLWARIETIKFASPSNFSSQVCSEFLTIRKKLDVLFNKVFASNSEALALIESINQEILNSPYSIFLPLLWDPRIKTTAARGKSYCAELIKPKIDELHVKINQIKDQP